MTHHHIRWEGGPLDPERFTSSGDAMAIAAEIAASETCTTEEYDDATCPHCAKHATAPLALENA